MDRKSRTRYSLFGTMEEVKKRLHTSILLFLKEEFRSGGLDADNAEGLEVAIQCLESIYGGDESKLANEPSLLEIYGSYFDPAVVCLPDLPEASEEDKRKAEQLKVEGNQAMNNGNYQHALELYTKAINYDKKNAIYYCNRAAAHSRLQDYACAIQDCKFAIELDPMYSKAYGRLGLAYCGLEDYENALDYYRKAVELEPDNEGYQNNYELTYQKVTNANKRASGPTGSSTATSDPMSTSAMHMGDGMPANFDFGAIFANPQLVNMATQMLTNPSMQSVMRDLMTDVDEGASRVDTLIDAGQRLASHIQSQNPDLYNQLRQSIGIDLSGQRSSDGDNGDSQDEHKNPGEKDPK